MRELEGKAAGDERAFIPSRAPGGKLNDSSTIPTTAGGEGVAKPDGVIHR
jgi:hypothetical protein